MPQPYFRVHDISPDGTRLLGIYRYEKQRRVVLTQLSLKDKTLRLPEYPRNVLFTPDGGLTGIQRIQGRTVAGAWPPGGGSFKATAPRMADFVYGGAVSWKGRIAMSRGRSTNDVVLITSRQEPK